MEWEKAGDKGVGEKGKKGNGGKALLEGKREVGNRGGGGGNRRGWHPRQASGDHYPSHPRRAMARGPSQHAWEKTEKCAIRGRETPRVYLRIRPGKQCVWRRAAETDAKG